MKSGLADKDLLYVGQGLYPFDVYVYDYRTKEQVGELAGFYEPSGMCVDKKGDVWITSNFTSQVFEYAHGGSSPIETLTTDGTPVGCSVSARGDLAVTNHATPSGPGDIEIWKNAAGYPKSYADPGDCYYLWPAGYDDVGNLFVESQTNICALMANGSALQKISFDQTIEAPNSVMWDGKNITLTDQRFNSGYSTGIYRAALNGSAGLKTVGSTILHASGSCVGPVSQPFFVGRKNTPINDRRSKVLVANLSCYSLAWIEYFRYPNGKTHAYFESRPVPTGQAVSLVPR